MTDSDKQLILNLDCVDSLKALVSTLCDDILKLKEELQQEKDGRCADLDESEAEIKELKEKNAELSELNDELESEVLDSRESYNLQQMSGNFWYKGEEFTDPETGETFSRSDYFDLLKECYDKNKKLKELSK
jgi:hypothetical protein